MTLMALVRHGRTGWNRLGRFTGWVDAPLDDEGRRQAQRAGERLAEVSPTWDAVYTSLLVRTIETADLAAAQLCRRPAMIRDWRLNERHFGALEGVLHADFAAAHGAEALEKMRWAWNHRPPPISGTDPRQADYAMKYPQAGAALPRGESLTDVIERVRPWWREVQSQVTAGQRAIVCTHGTTLRALRVLIEELTPDEIFTVRTENGAPVCYDIDQAGQSARID